MIWFDYVLVFIFILNLYKGFREGLLRQITALTSFFIAFYAALYWSSNVRGFLENNLNLNKVIASLSKDESTSLWLVDTLMNMVAFLILFFVLYFMLKFFSRRLSILNRVPLIGSVNAVSGAVVGGVKGILIVFLIATLLSLIKTEFWMNTIESSAVVALSSHYIPLLFELICNFVVNKLGTQV